MFPNSALSDGSTSGFDLLACGSGELRSLDFELLGELAFAENLERSIGVANDSHLREHGHVNRGSRVAAFFEHLEIDHVVKLAESRVGETTLREPLEEWSLTTFI